MKILTVIVNDFKRDKLDKRYSNFVNFEGDLIVSLTVMTNKNKNLKIKSNKNKKKKKSKKINKKNISKRMIVRGLKNEYFNLVSEEKIVRSFIKNGLVDPSSIDVISKKIESVKIKCSKFMMKRIDRRKAGYDRSYNKRQEMRRLKRGSEKAAVHFSDVPIFEKKRGAISFCAFKT